MAKPERDAFRARLRRSPAFEDLGSMDRQLTTDVPTLLEIHRKRAESDRLAVVQLNGKRLLGNQLSFEGRSRCMRVVAAFMGGEVPWHAVIVTSGRAKPGGLSEAQAFKNELVSQFTDLGWPMMADSIVLEDKAGNTFDNVRFTIKLIKRLFGRDQPEAWFVATSDYHYARQEITHRIVPEKSELRLLHETFPHAAVKPLNAPYPFRRHPDFERRWLAEVYLATQLFAPLQANLWALAEGLIAPEETPAPPAREDAVAVFQDGLRRLELLARGHGLRPGSGYAQQVDLVLDNLRRAGEALGSVLERIWVLNEPGAAALPAQWEGLARDLGRHTEAIRWPSDPEAII